MRPSPIAERNDRFRNWRIFGSAQISRFGSFVHCQVQWAELVSAQTTRLSPRNRWTYVIVLRSRGGGSEIEQRLGLGECGLVAHRREQVAGLGERTLAPRPPERDLAASLAEERMRVLGNVSELLPACRRFGIETRCFGIVSRVFRELGACGAKRVILERVAE